MTRTEIAADLRRHTGSGWITPRQLADWFGAKAVWRVSERYLKGLEHIGHRYLIIEVAGRIKEECQLGGDCE